MKLDLSTARTILCLGAHCDDIEIGCGATILKMLAANPKLNVWWVVLSGEPRRMAEAEASCHAFCRQAAETHFVSQNFRDRFFPNDGEQVKKFLHSVAAEVPPDLIFTHRREDLHQDHRTVAELTWNAFREHLILEYEIPKYEGDLGQPNVFVPVTSEIAERKISLLCQHFPSQLAKPWFDRDAFQAVMRLRGLECRSPTRFAEGLYGRKMVLAV
jgi:LmbE family N-acetylglucosaminyl deacetylase